LGHPCIVNHHSGAQTLHLGLHGPERDGRRMLLRDGGRVRAYPSALQGAPEQSLNKILTKSQV
jgi:hypothetical protein